MKISVICPVKNEVDFIGYSVMAVLPYVHEILYGLAICDDGTEDLLFHIKDTYDSNDKLKLYKSTEGMPFWDFDPMDMKAYNRAFNQLIKRATGDAVWFLHPDMVVTNPEAILDVREGPLAWYTNITSYAGDLQTKITHGRATKWKNIAAKQFGVHYFGGYGSVNEDFYFADITGEAYRHFGENFEEYPYEVADSGILVNHYCELKTYKRRLEKMKLCLKTQFPDWADGRIEEVAMVHPRVTLEPSNNRFGTFAFDKASDPIPKVFAEYWSEFDQFKKVLCPT